MEWLGSNRSMCFAHCRINQSLVSLPISYSAFKTQALLIGCFSSGIGLAIVCVVLLNGCELVVSQRLPEKCEISWHVFFRNFMKLETQPVLFS